jgi:hypothetical protein
MFKVNISKILNLKAYVSKFVYFKHVLVSCELLPPSHEKCSSNFSKID